MVIAVEVDENSDGHWMNISKDTGVLVLPIQ